MAVLSNNGRLISSLPLASTIKGQDELLIQSNGVTQRVTYSTFTSSILSSNTFNPYNYAVNFKSTDNKFTGSFYSINNKLANFAVVNVRQGITVFGLSTLQTVLGDSFTGDFYGNLFGNVDGNVSGILTGKLTGSATGSFKGKLTDSIINGTSIGTTSPSSIVGTTITASTGFLGRLTGDIYNANSNKVLENGSGAPTPNGGIPNAYFYGTSSYASRAFTSSYALASGGSATNGLPVGGSQYQIISKNSATPYDVSWITPVTRSGAPSQYDMTMWNSSYAIKSAPGFTYSSGADLYVFNKSVNTNLGLTGSVRGVVTSPTNEVKVTAASSYTINGDLYPANTLHISASNSTITLNLRNGKTCTVLIKNGGAYSISTWNASINGGASTTSIYWKSGTPPTITSGVGKKDVFTFVNVNDYVLGSAIQNFS